MTLAPLPDSWRIAAKQFNSHTSRRAEIRSIVHQPKLSSDLDSCGCVEDKTEQRATIASADAKI